LDWVRSTQTEASAGLMSNGQCPIRRQSLAKPSLQRRALPPSPPPTGVGRAAVVQWVQSMRGIPWRGPEAMMVSGMRAGTVLLLSCMAVSACATPCFDRGPCFPRTPPSGDVGRGGLVGAGWSLWGHGSGSHGPADPLRLRGGIGPRGRGRGGGGSGEDRWEAKAERDASSSSNAVSFFFFFFFTLGTGPRRSLSLKLSDTRVYEPQIRARLVTTATLPRRRKRYAQSVWSRQFGEPGFVFAPKLTDLYGDPSTSTLRIVRKARAGPRWH